MIFKNFKEWFDWQEAETDEDRSDYLFPKEYAKKAFESRDDEITELKRRLLAAEKRLYCSGYNKSAGATAGANFLHRAFGG